MMGSFADSFLSSTVTIDLKYQDRDRYIASCLLDCGQEVVLLDPGPSSTVGNLHRDLDDRGMRVSDIGAILLTHIHFDHAGATGSLVEQNPKIRVYVHERGAQHLIDPKRLLKSASRIFGANVEELWGPFYPVPARNLEILRGGEEIPLGARRFEALYTPGHAIHHVSFFEPNSEIAFVGDAAGVRTTDFVYPATPPPDIDLSATNESLDLILSREPRRLFLTHFGLVDRVEWHISEFRERLGRWSEFVRLSLDQEGNDSQRAQNFSNMVKAELSSAVSQEEAIWFEHSISSRQNWYGLARYWRQRGMR
jgi:glyoxylase-like metal-dependent hydrolase (beta-lactamase superfamily II)